MFNIKKNLKSNVRCTLPENYIKNKSLKLTFYDYEPGNKRRNKENNR